MAMVQIDEGARHAFPKLAANRTFRGDGLTDAIDLICDFGSRSIAYAFIQPDHFQCAKLPRPEPRGSQ